MVGVVHLQAARCRLSCRRMGCFSWNLLPWKDVGRKETHIVGWYLISGRVIATNGRWYFLMVVAQILSSLDISPWLLYKFIVRPLASWDGDPSGASSSASAEHMPGGALRRVAGRRGSEQPFVPNHKKQKEFDTWGVPKNSVMCVWQDVHPCSSLTGQDASSWLKDLDQ